MILSPVIFGKFQNAQVMKLSLFRFGLQSTLVFNIVSFSKWVAKSVQEYICVMIYFVPSPEVKNMPVLVFIFTPILFAKISPKSEYLLIHESLAFPDTINPVVPIVVDNQRSVPVYFLMSDQMYLLVSNFPPVVRVVQE